MDNDLEEELLMHIAAGTDLPTAMAALPRRNDSQDELPSSVPTKPVGAFTVAILAVVAMIVLWIILR